MNRRVPFLDLRVNDEVERANLLQSVETVLKHGRLILGPEVAELESQVAASCGRRYGIGVCSGTDALYLALRGLGLGPGDEVITTSLSWIATANAIALTGAVPVFADIGPDLNIDPASVARVVSKRTKAILPVHYTGKMCDLAELKRICERENMTLIEDAAQAFGAKQQGVPAGSTGMLACFSMNPMKVFAACGEAGMIVTDREDLHERLIALRYNGTVNREVCIEPSHNCRLDTIQAAMLLQRLSGVASLVGRRRELAAIYDRELAGIVQVPIMKTGDEDVYYTYTIQADRRDELMKFLAECGVETKIQHPYLMPQQPAYLPTCRGEWRQAEIAVKRILSLPVHEKLSDDDVAYVASCVARFYREGNA